MDVTNTELAAAITWACRAEALARKPGNVHPGASFDDMTVHDFLRSAEACAEPLSRSAAVGVGPSVLRAIRATRNVVSCNTNLGMVLLLAPLAAAATRDSLSSVLQQLTVADAEAVYTAIRLAQPGGLGQAQHADVSQTAQVTLLAAMELAQERDAVAREYATGFELTLHTGPRKLRDALSRYTTAMFGWPTWELAVVDLFLDVLAESPDTLIARKCGSETSRLASQIAQGVLQTGWPTTRAGWDQFRTLDAWLRADGNRRNPGTTADLVAAILFSARRFDGVGFALPVVQPTHGGGPVPSNPPPLRG